MHPHFRVAAERVLWVCWTEAAHGAALRGHVSGSAGGPAVGPGRERAPSIVLRSLPAAGLPQC